MENLNEKTYWLHAISPLHVGAGRGVGYIDLPIVREKATNWPYVPGSAVKGVIADAQDAAENKREKNSDIAAAFGRANQSGDSQASANAGSLVFSDASIVSLPVRSFYGTFAWITSPLVLNRLRSSHKPAFAPPAPEGEKIFTLEGSKITQNDKVYLEDVDLDAENCVELQAWADLLAGEVFAGDQRWQDIFKQRFALVNDDIFTFFCETGTEVAARIRIEEDTKIVASGALWYEESLPVETILAGVVWCDKVFGGQQTQAQLMEKFCAKPYDLQIGGKASTGKGRVLCVFS